MYIVVKHKSRLEKQMNYIGVMLIMCFTIGDAYRIISRIEKIWNNFGCYVGKWDSTLGFKEIGNFGIPPIIQHTICSGEEAHFALYTWRRFWAKSKRRTMQSGKTTTDRFQDCLWCTNIPPTCSWWVNIHICISFDKTDSFKAYVRNTHVSWKLLKYYVTYFKSIIYFISHQWFTNSYGHENVFMLLLIVVSVPKSI